jgi:prepilin-type processing-associated H-X9-DG protein
LAYLDGHVQDSAPPANSIPKQLAVSISNLKKVDLGAIIYANDYDEFAPLPNKWIDGLLPYVKNDQLFHSPAVVAKNPANYGYALNVDLAAANLQNLAAPITTIFFFDSSDLSRNATDPTSTLPNPPRYGAYNTIAYADGHVHQ